MSNFEKTIFYRDNCVKAKETGDGMEYTIECIDGTGTMLCYEVFPGLELFFNSFQAYHCKENREQSNMLKLNFCVSGRFECSFTTKDCGILGPGDMSANLFDGKHGAASICEFPLGYYEGVGILIDCDRATKWTEQNLGIFSLDFNSLKQHLFPSGWYWVRPSGPKCEHVFRELYENGRSNDLQYIRLKITELFLILERLPLIQKTESYFPKSQVELVKHLRDHIISDPTCYSSIEQLAAEHQISISQLQKVFRSIYGVPIYKYLREYRLEQAAVALQKTVKSITEIALDAGFTNPGKFSETFKRRYGMTPTDYRNYEKLNTEMD